MFTGRIESSIWYPNPACGKKRGEKRSRVSRQWLWVACNHKQETDDSDDSVDSRHTPTIRSVQQGEERRVCGAEQSRRWYWCRTEYSTVVVMSLSCHDHANQSHWGGLSVCLSVWPTDTTHWLTYLQRMRSLAPDPPFLAELAALVWPARCTTRYSRSWDSWWNRGCYFLYSTVQYSTVQYHEYSIVQYSTVQYHEYSIVQYSTV